MTRGNPGARLPKKSLASINRTYVVQEARPKNHAIDYMMRFCEHCGVGIGMMDREDYATKYIHAEGECPQCEHEAYSGGRPETAKDRR